MKVFFEKTNGNNLVIIAEGRNAKIYDGAPSGIYAGVDLYAEDAADQLRARFQELDEADELSDFDDLGGEEIRIGRDLFTELACDAELVFSSFYGGGIEIWSVQNSEDCADDIFCGSLEECRYYCREFGHVLGEGWQIGRISVDDDFCHEMTEEVIDEEW